MPGKIKVKILAGRNLPVMDRSGDTTDAYVEIKFGNTTYKTDVCRKTLNPQWNTEWYRFEVDDAELQDEPLQIRLMDHDTYSANDAIGKVYLNLNPLLLPGLPLTVKNIWTLEANMNSSTGAQGGSVMTGWIPVYDTMHGIRGEVNIIVKVELFSDFNKFRQSSCGVQFFYSPNVPHGYHAQVIHGFVEELIVSDDPEYKWIDKIRTPRASNEARQTLFFKISGEVQRKIGLKAMDLGGNAVIGYVQNFDLEGESGIVARGIGTAVTLIKVQDLTTALVDTANNNDDLVCYSYPSKLSPLECSESDDSLPLLSSSPSNYSPILRPSPKIHKTQIGNHFPKPEKLQTRSRSVRIAEYHASSLKRQISLQGSSPSNLKKTGLSSQSLTDDLITESSLKMMLALEDMRGESTSVFSRGLKNLKYLPKRVIQMKSRISDSFDDESDQDSFSSSWSIVGSDSGRSSITNDLRQMRRKKLTHKKNSAEIGVASLIRSVHTGFPLDSVREDRETPTPSPVNLLNNNRNEKPSKSGDENLPENHENQDDHDKKPFKGVDKIPEVPEIDEEIDDKVDENLQTNDLIIVAKKEDLKNIHFDGNINIPMMSSSETDTSTSDDDEPSESSTNYNILDDSLTYIASNEASVDEKPLETKKSATKTKKTSVIKQNLEQVKQNIEKIEKKIMIVEKINRGFDFAEADKKKSSTLSSSYGSKVFSDGKHRETLISNEVILECEETVDESSTPLLESPPSSPDETQNRIEYSLLPNLTEELEKTDAPDDANYRKNRKHSLGIVKTSSFRLKILEKQQSIDDAEFSFPAMSSPIENREICLLEPEFEPILPPADYFDSAEPYMEPLFKPLINFDSDSDEFDESKSLLRSFQKTEECKAIKWKGNEEDNNKLLIDVISFDDIAEPEGYFFEEKTVIDLFTEDSKENIEMDLVALEDISAEKYQIDRGQRDFEIDGKKRLPLSGDNLGDLGTADVFDEGVDEVDNSGKGFLRQEVGNVDVFNQDVSDVDVFDKKVSDMDVFNEEVGGADVFNEEVSSFRVFNQEISNVDVFNEKVSDLKDVFNEEVDNADIFNKEVRNVDVSNEEVGNVDVFDEKVSNIEDVFNKEISDADVFSNKKSDIDDLNNEKNLVEVSNNEISNVSISYRPYDPEKQKTGDRKTSTLETSSDLILEDSKIDNFDENIIFQPPKSLEKNSVTLIQDKPTILESKKFPNSDNEKFITEEQKETDIILTTFENQEKIEKVKDVGKAEEITEINLSDFSKPLETIQAPIHPTKKPETELHIQNELSPNTSIYNYLNPDIKNIPEVEISQKTEQLSDKSDDDMNEGISSCESEDSLTSPNEQLRSSSEKINDDDNQENFPSRDEASEAFETSLPYKKYLFHSASLDSPKNANERKEKKGSRKVARTETVIYRGPPKIPQIETINPIEPKNEGETLLELEQMIENPNLTTPAISTTPTISATLSTPENSTTQTISVTPTTSAVLSTPATSTTLIASTSPATLTAPTIPESSSTPENLITPTVSGTSTSQTILATPTILATSTTPTTSATLTNPTSSVALSIPTTSETLSTPETSITPTTSATVITPTSSATLTTPATSGTLIPQTISAILTTPKTSETLSSQTIPESPITPATSITPTTSATLTTPTTSETLTPPTTSETSTSQTILATPTTPVIIVAPSTETDCFLRVPMADTKDIKVHSPHPKANSPPPAISKPEPQEYIIDPQLISERFHHKYRQYCMFDLLRTIDTKMMVHSPAHSRKDSTRSKRRRKANISTTPSPDSIRKIRQHRKNSRSKSPEKHHHHHHHHHHHSHITSSHSSIPHVSSCTSLSLKKNASFCDIPLEQLHKINSFNDTLLKDKSKPPAIIEDFDEMTKRESDSFQEPIVNINNNNKTNNNNSLIKNDDLSKTNSKKDDLSKISVKNDDLGKINVKNDDLSKINPKNDDLSKVNPNNDDLSKINVKNDVNNDNEIMIKKESSTNSIPEVVKPSSSMIKSTNLMIPIDLDPVHKSHSEGSLGKLKNQLPMTKMTNIANMNDPCVPCPPFCLRQQNEPPPPPTSPVHPASALPASVGAKVTNSPASKAPLHRRSSDSDLSITPKGNSLAGSDRSMGTHLKPSTAIVRTMNQDALEMLEYPFITIQQYPPGFVLNLGGLVSARSVKLIERITNPEEPDSRDAWWTEIRMEVRSHARALGCNVVLGYKEEISICDDVCVLNASGTAAVINLLNTNQDHEILLNKNPPTAITSLVDAEKIQHKSIVNKNSNEKDDVPITGQTHMSTGGKVKRISESNDHELPNTIPYNNSCYLCHLPYNEASVPFKVDVSKCAICKRAKVPDVLFTTIELPDNIPITGRGVFIQATVCKCKRDLRGELNAKEISDCLPFLEYELHSLLLNKLKVKGMNAVFGLKVQVSIGERLIVGMAVGTAVFLTAMPSPSIPQIASGNSWHKEDQVAEMQKSLFETVKKNRELYRLKPAVDTENIRIPTSDTDDSDEDLPDLDLGLGTKDACILEVDDVEDMDRINLLMDESTPEDFHVVNTQSIPGLDDLEIVRNLQMFTQISRTKIPAGQSSLMPSKYFARLLQTVFFKLRRMVPCALCDMQFKVALPEQDEIQLSVVGMALGLGEPLRISKYKRKGINNSTSRDILKKTDDNDLIFNLDEDHSENIVTLETINQSHTSIPNSSPVASQTQKSRPRSPFKSKTHSQYKHKHVPLKERYGVDITPLSYLPGGRIERYLGNLNFFFIRESTSIRENGGLSGFTHSFITEVLAIVRAHITALGGNAMVAFFMTQCVLLHSPHKNQGQCLINVGGDVVSVSYFGDEKYNQNC